MRSMRDFPTARGVSGVARSMPASPRHHLWPDPASRPAAGPEAPEAGSTGTQELLLFTALLAAAVLVAAVWNLRDFVLLSGGATLGALIVGRLAAASREQVQALER